MADAKMEGRAAAVERFGRLPASVKKAVEGQLNAEADDLVAALQRAAPVNEFDQHPGQLREDIEKRPDPNRKRALSIQIISFARDLKGRLYGAWVEFGHDTAAPRPWWWPTYRARRKAMRRRMSGAALKAIRALFPKTT